ILELHQELNPPARPGIFDGLSDRGHRQRACPFSGLLHSALLEGVLGLEADPGAVFGQLVEQTVATGDPRGQNADAGYGRTEQARPSHLPPSFLGECWSGCVTRKHNPSLISSSLGRRRSCRGKRKGGAARFKWNRIRAWPGAAITGLETSCI